MTDKDLKQGVTRGFFWKALENGGDQAVTFLISIVLARLVGPEKYGTMSVLLIFVTIANVVIQSGFQTALIQKKEADEDDFTSVFWLGLLVSLVLYLIIFAAAPFISVYFEDPSIKSMLRVLSLILFSGSVTSLLFARIARDLNFRLQCLATIAAGIVSGTAGIIAAMNGAGTWALIIQQLLKNVLLAVILSVLLKYVPRGHFSMEKVKSLFSYGWKVLVSGLIDTVYTNLYTPVIQKLYDPVMVGLYNRANQFPLVLAQSGAATMQSVLLPAFSKTNGESEKGRAIMRRSLKLSGYIMFPAMFGIMAVAEPLTLAVLGEDWMGAVPLLRLCCLSFSVWHIHVANLQAINASGRSDIYLKLEIIKKAAGILVLILSVRFGVTVMILFKALFDYVCTFINGAPNKKLIGYSPLKQWRDMLPEFLCASVMGAATYFSGILYKAYLPVTGGAGNLLLLAAEICTGAVIYLLLSLIFKLESFRYLLNAAAEYIPVLKKYGNEN